MALYPELDYHLIYNLKFVICLIWQMELIMLLIESLMSFVALKGNDRLIKQK